jgi:hypothetical protein
MLDAVRRREDEHALAALREQVESFCQDFPVPGL